MIETLRILLYKVRRAKNCGFTPWIEIMKKTMGQEYIFELELKDQETGETKRLKIYDDNELDYLVLSFAEKSLESLTREQKIEFLFYILGRDFRVRDLIVKVV